MQFRCGAGCRALLDSNSIAERSVATAGPSKRCSLLNIHNVPHFEFLLFTFELFQNNKGEGITSLHLFTTGNITRQL